jgi:Domain of unknown function (DUF222)
MSDVLDRPATESLSVALAEIDAAIERLAAVETWALDGQELTGAVQELHRLQSRMSAQSSRLVAEVDVRGAAVELGAPCTAAWLTWALRLHPGAAKRAVRIARALHCDPAGPLVPAAADETAAAGATGLA